MNQHAPKAAATPRRFHDGFTPSNRRGSGPTSLGVLAVAGVLVLAGVGTRATAQPVLFDFDNAPLFSPLPISLTVGGIKACLSAPGQGFSVQKVGTAGIAPVGFAGLCIYPNSIFAADLIVSFDRLLTDFSIMYSPQELGCDDSAKMRVTAYKAGAVVGTNTTTSPAPGTWPTGVLMINVAQGFDKVIVHYDAKPPTCQDWGPIFLADNMVVTAAPTCYADCDANGSLAIDDFICFQTLFAIGDPAADCDGDTLLSIDDFICFQTMFAIGC